MAREHSRDPRTRDPKAGGQGNPGEGTGAALGETWRWDQVGGVVLVIGTLVAVGLASSPWAGAWRSVVQARLPVAWLAPRVTTAQDWVNDGLLTVFFFVVGLELARSRLPGGSLQGWRRSLGPILGAAGGMAGAALCYLLVVGTGPLGRGWGVPMATDAALVAASAALLGARVPQTLRTFLLALAVADDLGSVAVLAWVSGRHPSVPWLALAAGILVVVALMGRWRGAAWPAVLGAVVLWLVLARAGVEPALAGALAGATTPPGAPGTSSVTAVLEPVAQGVVLPLFALANLGIDLRGALLGAPGTLEVFLGVLLARVLGKPLGVFLGGRCGQRLASLRESSPKRTGPRGPGSWALAGGGALAGAGVTVPLLFAETVFRSAPGLEHAAAAGLMLGTLGASALGAGILLARPVGTPKRPGARSDRDP
jgi:NhaA family Na+:H+ antiporter